eukprot:1133975-Alexandrium_andersonii.AAC.1
MSAAVLFIDVSSAFYVVLRPPVLAARAPDEALEALRDKGIDPETLDYIARHVDASAAVDKGRARSPRQDGQRGLARSQ